MSSKSDAATLLKTYVVRSFKATHPKQEGLTGQAVDVLDQFLRHIIVDLTERAKVLAQHAGRKTVQLHDVETASRVYFTEDLANMIKEHGDFILKRFRDPTLGKPNERTMLKFSIARVANLMRSTLTTAVRLQPAAAAYLTMAVEYLNEEITNAAIEIARKDGRVRIKPRDIFLAGQADADIAPLISAVTIREGGILPGSEKEEQEQEEEVAAAAANAAPKKRANGSGDVDGRVNDNNDDEGGGGGGSGDVVNEKGGSKKKKGEPKRARARKDGGN